MTFKGEESSSITLAVIQCARHIKLRLRASTGGANTSSWITLQLPGHGSNVIARRGQRYCLSLNSQACCTIGHAQRRDAMAGSLASGGKSTAVHYLGLWDQKYQRP